jgi:hypothetical protein
MKRIPKFWNPSIHLRNTGPRDSTWARRHWIRPRQSLWRGPRALPLVNVNPRVWLAQASGLGCCHTSARWWHAHPWVSVARLREVMRWHCSSGWSATDHRSRSLALGGQRGEHKWCARVQEPATSGFCCAERRAWPLIRDGWLMLNWARFGLGGRRKKSAQAYAVFLYRNTGWTEPESAFGPYSA